MSYNKDLSIIAQNAGTTAANLLAAYVGALTASGGTVTHDLDEYLKTFEQVRELVFKGTLDLAGDKTPVSVQDVVREFPGTTVEQGAPVNGSGTFTFKGGKHQGKTIAEVDAEPGRNGRDVGRDYLQWYADKGNDDPTKRAVKAYLAAA